ncbi:MAG: response regulator [Lachnospiraceae bacterium]|nr:response regulator [Lachnospiraceae bacterium]MDE7031001.1 response regulator [Lachnospiraceae bacterium]
MQSASQKNNDIKILVVDDVEVNLIILEEIIKNMGYQALLAQSVKEALKIIEESETLPGIILSDISMPETDGFTFCSMLKNDPYTKDIPVIFISAMDTASDLSKGFELGAVDYIPKPFEKTEVEMRISTHLKIYTMQRDLEENNKQLNLVVARQMEKLRIEQKNVMTALARLVESREHATGNHYKNILYNSRILAEGMQLSPMFEDDITDDFIDTIESSAGLHDIGKLMIPDHILLKNAPLDEEERRIMCTHAELGARTLMDIYEGVATNDFIDMAIDIAWYHHECWDGSGYPKGLKGSEIPLAARIVKVVDVFDAMIGERRYKEPVSLVQTLAYMQENAGKSFDPDIIRVFMRIYRNFKGTDKI